MCNLSLDIATRGIEEGREEGIKKERLDAIARMIQASFTKEQIILCGYTEEELRKVEKERYVNA